MLSTEADIRTNIKKHAREVDTIFTFLNSIHKKNQFQKSCYKTIKELSIMHYNLIGPLFLNTNMPFKELYFTI